MKKKASFSSLTVKIPVQITALLLLVMIFLSSAVVLMSRNATTSSIQNEVDYLAQMNASKVYSYLENMNAFSHSLSKEVQRYGELEREEAEPVLTEALKGVLENDKIFGAYFAFEPNRYFPQTPKGLSYYAYRDGSKISVDILSDYDTYSTGDYYIGARNSNATYVTEPYPYELTNGETVQLITLSTPVHNRKGDFIGVANCDILADSINAIEFDTGSYKTAYSTILSGQGMYIADSFDKKRAGTPFEGSAKDSILESMQRGKSLLMEGRNEHFEKEEAIVNYIPITLKGTNLQWVSGFIVSRSEVFSDVNFMTAIIILICAVSLLLLSLFIHRIIKHSLSPISYVMKLADKMRRCDLTETAMGEQMKLSDDELGQLVHIFKEVSDGLTAIIQDINYCLGNMAAGNFRVNSQCETLYVGGYSYVLRDMKKNQGKAE